MSIVSYANHKIHKYLLFMQQQQQRHLKFTYRSSLRFIFGEIKIQRKILLLFKFTENPKPIFLDLQNELEFKRLASQFFIMLNSLIRIHHFWLEQKCLLQIQPGEGVLFLGFRNSQLDVKFHHFHLHSTHGMKYLAQQEGISSLEVYGFESWIHF